MKKNILVFLLTSFYSFGIAPKHLDGKRIKFTYEESMVIEFTDKDAYEVFGETERSEAMSYDADTEGDKVKVTVYGSDGANDVYTLNFSTEKSGSGNLQDFAYLTFGEADETFEPTSETNIYKDLEGSGDFRFEVVDPQGGFPITDNDHGTVTGGGIAPKHLDGKRIKFTYEESMVIEFTDKDAYEVFGETERSEAMSYDADTEGDKVKVTVYGSDGANDVYTLNFSTEKSGSGNLQDFAYLTFGEADETFEPTSETNIYKDLEGSGDFRFEVLDPQGGFPITDNDHGTVTGGGIAAETLGWEKD